MDLNTLGLLSAFIERGATEALDVVQGASSSGRFDADLFSEKDRLNILMLILLVHHKKGELTLGWIEEAAGHLRASSVPDGSKVVYALLMSDLARAIGVKLSLGQEYTASGKTLDWELLKVLQSATSTFARRAQELLRHGAATGDV